MSEWKDCRLKDLTIRITKGTTPSTIGGAFLTKGINFIKSESVSYNGKIDKTTFAFISEDTHNKLKRSQLERNDILYSMAGIYLGKSGFVTDDILPANTNQALAIIKVDPVKALPKFIHFVLQQKNVIEYVNTISGQSAQPNINMEEIGSIELLLPPLPEQERIAEVLSSLDDKIDLLHRNNKTLEQLAETLFRQWFVEEAEDSWEEVKLGSVVQTILGGTPSTEKKEYWNGTIAWINSGEVNNDRIIKPTKYISELGLNNSNTKLLPRKTTVMAITGATMGQVSYLEIETCANQSVVGIIPNELFYPEYLHLLVKNNVEFIIQNETGGAQPHINKNDINNTIIKVPPKDLLNNAKNYLEILYDKISNNCWQIQQLETLRDTLLPKLMSGEVRVQN